MALRQICDFREFTPSLAFSLAQAKISQESPFFVRFFGFLGGASLKNSNFSSNIVQLQ